MVATLPKVHGPASQTQLHMARGIFGLAGKIKRVLMAKDSFMLRCGET
jgi:hypothetical protein